MCQWACVWMMPTNKTHFCVCCITIAAPKSSYRKRFCLESGKKIWSKKKGKQFPIHALIFNQIHQIFKRFSCHRNPFGYVGKELLLSLCGNCSPTFVFFLASSRTFLKIIWTLNVRNWNKKLKCKSIGSFFQCYLRNELNVAEVNWHIRKLIQI